MSAVAVPLVVSLTIAEQRAYEKRQISGTKPYATPVGCKSLGRVRENRTFSQGFIRCELQPRLFDFSGSRSARPIITCADGYSGLQQRGAILDTLSA